MPTSSDATGAPDFRQLLDISSDALGVVSLATGCWLAGNGTLVRLLGWSERELAEIDALELVRPREREHWGVGSERLIYLRARSGDYIGFTWRFDRNETAGLLYCAGRPKVAVVSDRAEEIR